MPVVNMLDAKTSLSRLVEAVESGAESEIIIARNGKPAARLVPVQTVKKTGRKLGMFEGEYPPFTLEEWNSTDAEIAEMFGVDKP
ncbi:MAG TPA: type II toxin-antitoxin system prevent-host-death family antitoxin [Mesorhizobium sp.]|jgi:prevent-host-death family protein